MHMGLDMTPGGGTPIGAVAAGTVRTAGVHAPFGTYVVLGEDEGTRRIVERAPAVDPHAVVAPVLDGAKLQHPRARGRHLQHLAHNHQPD